MKIKKKKVVFVDTVRKIDHFFTTKYIRITHYNMVWQILNIIIW